jgi:hypothetical protein
MFYQLEDRILEPQEISKGSRAYTVLLHGGLSVLDLGRE